ALKTYTDLAHDLAGRLAAAHGLHPADLFAEQDALGRRGQVDDWRFLFHGHECEFTHAETGTIIDVVICYGDDFRALEAFFFGWFIRTSPAHRAALRVFAENILSAYRLFDLLTQLGVLQRVELPFVRHPVPQFAGCSGYALVLAPPSGGWPDAA